MKLLQQNPCRSTTKRLKQRALEEQQEKQLSPGCLNMLKEHLQLKSIKSKEGLEKARQLAEIIKWKQNIVNYRK